MSLEGENRVPRKRRTKNGLEPVMEKRKNSFKNYAYAGRPEAMKKLFPRMIKSIQNPDEYFSLISEGKLSDEKVIKIYGENLRKARKEHKNWPNCSLDIVSKSIGISYQNLSEIEKGKRTKIDRDILLLLSGFYHIPPETLLGIEDSSLIEPMLFFPKRNARMTTYILDQLYYDSPILLLALLNLEVWPSDDIGTIVNDISSEFNISILTSIEISAKILLVLCKV